MAKITRRESESPSAVGYVRCGLSADYGLHKDGRPANYLTPSTCSFNPPYREQKNVLRRHARSRGLRLIRVFCDLEESGTLGLLERTELIRLFAEIGGLGARVVLIQREDRLCEEPLLAGLLLRLLLSRRVEVIDASSGARLTSRSCAKGRLEGRGEAETSRALSLFRRFKSLVTMTKNRTGVGRKAYGATEQEEKCLRRLRELCALLPRDQWRRRGKRILTRRSFRQIAGVLNTEGFATRQGRPWAARTVQEIVEREFPAIYRTWSRAATAPDATP